MMEVSLQVQKVSSTFWPKFDRKKAFVAAHSVRWGEMELIPTWITQRSGGMMGHDGPSEPIIIMASMVGTGTGQEEKERVHQWLR
jgi:hypothetical protein